MSLRQIARRLLRQRDHPMPNDSDTDVMKIVVGKDRDIPLIVRQSVAQVAAGLCVERFPATLSRVANGVFVSRDEMIERRVERHERPLVGGNSAQHVLLVHTATEGLDELPLVIL